MKSSTRKSKAIEWRRDKISEYIGKEYSAAEMAAKLQVSVKTIYVDIAALNRHAEERIENYPIKNLPMVFDKTMKGIDMLINEAWKIIDDPGVGVREKLVAMNVAGENYNRRLDITSSVKMLVKIMRHLQHKKDQIQFSNNRSIDNLPPSLMDRNGDPLIDDTHKGSVTTENNSSREYRSTG